MTGLWANVDPMEVAHIDVWRRDPERFWDFYGQRFAILDGKRPNGAHRAIAELERRGLVSGVVTQNIDGLHALAGSYSDRGPRVDPDRLVPGLRRVLLAGRDPRAVPAPAVRLRRGPEAGCRALRRAAARAGDAAGDRAGDDRRPDARGRLLAWRSGRSPACPRTRCAPGGKLAIVTMGETPYDRYAEVKLSGDVVARARGGRRRARSLGGVEGAGAQRGFEAGERGGDDLDARRLEAALAGGEGRGADRVEVAAELFEAVGEVAVGDPAGELGDRGRQRSLKLKCSFRVAAAVEIAAGAQGELLAGERDVAGGEQRREPLGRAVLGAAAGARRLGLARARAPRSTCPSASSPPVPTPARTTCARPGSGTDGSAAETRWAERKRARQPSARRRHVLVVRGPGPRRRRSPSRASPGTVPAGGARRARRRGASASVTTTTSWTSSPA